MLKSLSIWLVHSWERTEIIWKKELFKPKKMILKLIFLWAKKSGFQKVVVQPGNIVLAHRWTPESGCLAVLAAMSA